MDTTNVIFRGFQGEVVALFPDERVDFNPANCSSYSTIGQHSAANYGHVVENSTFATVGEYSPLKAELEAIG